jgi:hypothetical protein
VLSAFVFGNIQLLLRAGIGEPYDLPNGRGIVGHDYRYPLRRVARPSPRTRR